jgi:Na+/H+-dicarboxylate symporter
MKLPKLSSSTNILVGLLAGVFVGLFFGAHAAVLKVVADGFVKLLQITVLPYIALDHHQSGRAELRSGQNTWGPGWDGSHWLVVSRAGFHVPFSFGLF